MNTFVPHLNSLHEGSSSCTADHLTALPAPASLYADSCLSKPQQLIPQLKLQQRGRASVNLADVPKGTVSSDDELQPERWQYVKTPSAHKVLLNQGLHVNNRLKIPAR